MSLLLMLFCAVTWMRAAVYHDELTLWRDTALKSPGKARTHYSLGDELKKTGDLEGARRHLERALELKPDYTDALGDLATLYCQIGSEKKCYELLQKALSLNPGHLWTRYKLAMYYYRKGLRMDAFREYNAVILIDPQSKEAAFAGQMLLMIQEQITESPNESTRR